jgi:hypothetical protein
MGGALPSLEIGALFAAGIFASTPCGKVCACATSVNKDVMKTNPTMNNTKVRDMYFSFYFSFTNAYLNFGLLHLTLQR